MPKLDKNTYPANHRAEDFDCFGPAASVDGQFNNCMIADLGFYDQEGKNSNKYYHSAIVRSRKNTNWYVYREWGRTGAKKCDFQFETAISKEDAQLLFAEQLIAKNTKRGRWTEIAGIKTLVPKVNAKGKAEDCYIVRHLSTRDTGLPDARCIKSVPNVPAVTSVKVRSSREVDKPTLKLLQDLNKGAVSYTRSAMTNASIPSQESIAEARKILESATQRISYISQDPEKQADDKELRELTTFLYKRIPRHIPLGTTAKDSVLGSHNILSWSSDLDAFESAIYSQNESSVDPYDGMNITMEWIEPTSRLGRFLGSWWCNATRNMHSNMGKMEILNAWKVTQHDRERSFHQKLMEIRATNVEYPCIHQPKERFDLSPEEIDLYKKSNTAYGFHGSRSCNIAGILRKGLLLPKKTAGVKINGAFLGMGLYWAQDILKSCQYVSLPKAMWTKGQGNISGRGVFMFVADVILGNPYCAKVGAGYSEAPNGFHSVLGKGGYTGTLKHDEWVIYDESQHRMRYLIEFKEKSR